MTDKVEMMTVDQSVVILSKFIKIISTALTSEEAERLINLLTVNEQRVRLEINEVISNLVVNKNDINLEKFTVGDRVYKIIYFSKEEGGTVTSHFAAERAELLSTNHGKEDCIYILEHQNSISIELRKKTQMIFPNYQNYDDNNRFAYLIWRRGLLIRKWHLLGESFDSRACVVLRVK